MTEEGAAGPPPPPSTSGEATAAPTDPGTHNETAEIPLIDISVGNPPDPAPHRPGLVVLFAASLAASVIIHAAIIGANLVRLPPLTHPDEEAVPVTVVEDPVKEEAQPETEAKAPAEKPPPPAPETPAPQTEAPGTEAPKETQADSRPPPQAPIEQPKTTPPSAAKSPSAPETPASAEKNPPPQENQAEPSGPVAGSIDETSTHEAVAALRAQIEKCWSIPPGWTSPRQVTVVLDIRLERSGALAGKPVPVEFSATELGMEAAKNAIAAATRCAPYSLPADQYEKWHEAQVRLSPR
jgi:hypothetical protein